MDKYILRFAKSQVEADFTKEIKQTHVKVHYLSK